MLKRDLLAGQSEQGKGATVVKMVAELDLVGIALNQH